ncbi:MAG: 4-hydroxythreonine-4-phosphate dehydrogenase PdxA [Ignavibacteriae bacterium]|nr:4-hydroxythreonine-4-phosphate dehydrogenase PdxA [Ignavibacteriota bacterium]MCB9217084.1 4-hydroxythreonine-4-phosphate dehydrogenase PdxA [Ignavibacteria bacterium]
MSSLRKLPQLLLTVGDINGIGPEVLLKALRRILPTKSFVPTIIGNSRLLEEYLQALPLHDVSLSASELRVAGETIAIVDLPSEATLSIGSETADAGKLAGDAIHKGVAMLLDGSADGIVTMPISKSGLNSGGHHWPGHTEMLADLSGGNNPLMILASREMRVALMTIHVPLRQVPSLITPSLLSQRIHDFHNTLHIDFALPSPRIAVLGLNPHAGESGSIGREEVETLVPAIEVAQAKGYSVEGPFPADGFFARYRPGMYDGILAAYHDQGLIPLKMTARGAGVNITAGLSIVRTSPDHGTAFAIAGNGEADESSTVEAIEMALSIIENRTSSANREQLATSTTHQDD